MPNEDSTWAVQNTQTSSSTWDDFVLDFWDGWEGTNMSNWDTKTWTSSDDVSTDDINEDADSMQHGWDIEENGSVSEENDWEINSLSDDTKDDFDFSIDFDWNNGSESKDMDSKISLWSDEDDEENDGENNEEVDEENNEEVDEGDNEENSEKNNEDDNSFLQDDDLFEQAWDSNTLDNEISTDLDDNIEEDDISDENDISDANDIDFEEDKYDNDSEWTSENDIENNEEQDTQYNLDEISDNNGKTESINDNDDKDLDDWYEEIDLVNDFEYQDNQDADIVNEQAESDDEETLQEIDDDPGDNAYLDETETDTEYEWTEHQEDENIVDDVQPVDEEEILWDSLDEQPENEDINRDEEKEIGEDALLDSEPIDDKESSSEINLWWELNQQENESDERLLINKDSDNNLNEYNEDIKDSEDDSNISEKLSTDEDIETKEDQQDFMYKDNDIEDRTDKIENWWSIEEQPIQWNIEIQQLEGNTSLDISNQPNEEHLENEGINTGNLETQMWYNQDNQAQNLQIQDSSDYTTNLTNETTGNQILDWNEWVQTQELPQFNVKNEYNQWQTDIVEIKSTLSLDQILDSEMSANPELVNNSNINFQNNQNYWWKSSNRKMSVLFIWIWAFVIVWILAFMAFPTLLWEKNPWNTTTSWDNINTWIEYIWDEVDEHPSAFEWSSDIEIDQQEENIGDNFSENQSSSSEIEFPDAYIEMNQFHTNKMSILRMMK